MYLCTVIRKQSTNQLKLIIMFNNLKLSAAVVDFVRDITDCNQSLVFYLLMAATTSDIESVTESLCRQIDSITGCGYTYIHRNVCNFHVLYFID